MRIPPSFLPVAILFLGTGLLGCSPALDPTLGPTYRAVESGLAVPAAPGAGERFYPLEIGNRWTYRGGFRLAFDNGNDPLQLLVEVRSATVRTMRCDEVIEGLPYRVEYSAHTEWSDLGPQTSHAWIRFREDRDGLYERDIATSTPGCPRPDPSRVAAATMEHSLVEGLEDLRVRDAARAALARVDAVREVLRRGPSIELQAARTGEITRLRYPLVEGATWAIRSEPRVVATVEGLDHFEVEEGLMPAYRIRIDWPGVAGPHDLIHVWYGRAGYLGMNAHLEFGSDIGLMIADQTDTPVSINLVRGRF